MYDEFAEERLQQLPGWTDTDWRECRRRLSRLFFAVIQLRLNGLDLGNSQEAVEKACDYLRRLVNAIEQLLFSESVQGNNQVLQRARSYAFIAAEALDLWCNFAKLVKQDASSSESTYMTYARIESALLYLASDYQVNAHCSVAEINDHMFLDICDQAQRDSYIILYLQSVIISLATGNLQNIPNIPYIDYDQFDSVVAARVAAMVRIGTLISSYCEWLTGTREENEVAEGLQRLLGQLKPTSETFSSGQFGDLLHLCMLLIHVVGTSAPLSVMHHLPRLEMDQEATNRYERYLATRASHRPFLWPSAKEYVEQALPGPHADAVVVVPTGSGKSFLAELACSQAMQNGWVLYLAPTNALVNQIRHDLRSAFRTFGEVQILSFIGGQEYTSLAGELLDTPSNMSVAVMTPEKCAMAFRINPHVFQNCKLCIVDEFHTINDENRGMTLDLCLAQILTLNPETRLLLMSAMVSNGNTVASWLQRLRDGQDVPLIQVPWRPCRTLRSLLFVNKEGTEGAFKAARLKFAGLSAKRRHVRFDAQLGLLGGMCSRWEVDGNTDDYVSVPLPFAFDGRAKRGVSEMNRGGADWNGWKNTTGTQLSEALHKSGSSVLCFILTSRHHVFSCAEKTDLDCCIALDHHTNALLDLATAELGVSSRVGELLCKGVGVHSSAMLDAEQAAVERSFANRSIGLLFATPTLAQGLNLPADVVVVAGSSLGGAQQTEEDKLQGVRGPDATILNAFGRAGRAMLANHGLAVLVSDQPFFGALSESIGVNVVIQQYGLLSGTDRCVQVASPVESFVLRLSPGLPLDSFTTDELGLVAQLSEGREQNAEVLAHTFGAYLAQRRETELSLESAAGRIRDIGDNLILEHDMPEWVPVAAMKGGIDLLTCWRLWQGLCASTQILEDMRTANLQDCLSIFVEVMRQMPPRDIRKILPDYVRQMNTVLDRMLNRIGNEENAVHWVAPDDWGGLWTELANIIWMYMDGQTYVEIATTFLAVESEKVDGSRSQGQAPIPAVFSFIGRVLHNLSIYAGALLVILEESNLINGEIGQMPLLPLSIRNGCSDRDSLAWLRYGYRNRMAAHEFARQFPIPPEIQDDRDVKVWVTEKRTVWLREDHSDNESVILRSVWHIMNS